MYRLVYFLGGVLIGFTIALIWGCILIKTEMKKEAERYENADKE